MSRNENNYDFKPTQTATSEILSSQATVNSKDEKIKFDSNKDNAIENFINEILSSNSKINNVVIDNEDGLDTLVMKTSYEFNPDERIKLVDDTFFLNLWNTLKILED